MQICVVILQKKVVTTKKKFRLKSLDKSILIGVY